MKHRVAELEGALLDAAVAMAEGFNNRRDHFIATLVFDNEVRVVDNRAPYSTKWALGGPIIERERIELAPVTKGRWVASASGTDFNEAGPTPLIAAMRAYVASKYGETVDLPD